MEHISRVEILLGNTKLGEDTTAPYTLPWNAVPIGSYTLRAVATDNLNARATSAVVNVTVAVSTARHGGKFTPPAGSVSTPPDLRCDLASRSTA